MGDLKWFSDTEVPIFMTCGVNEKLPIELVQFILDLSFERGVTGEANYFQFFDIESNGEIIKIKMQQENPEMITKCTIAIKTDKKFTGRVYCIETWNGVEKPKATIDDHYIMVLLPEEY